MITKKVICIEP